MHPTQRAAVCSREIVPAERCRSRARSIVVATTIVVGIDHRAPTAQVDDVDPSRPTALIVEDDDDIREALEAVAEHAGFEPVSVENGLAALRYLHGADHPPNVILLDMMMPLMDGWQFLKRREQGFSAIPVIVITGTNTPGVPPDVEVLSKPVSLERVVQALRPHWH
jgi:CheY-like chemotaxis protein